jgi:hypothetical protein
MADIRSKWEDAEWFNPGETWAFVSTTQIRFSGADKTAAWHVGRRVRVVGSSTGTIYGEITTSAFSTDTTLTIDFDSGTLANETYTSVSYGILSTANPAASSVTTFPKDTIMAFQQTAAPVGWTKETTHDDKALRVVTGTPSSGGSVAFSTVFGLTATDAHTLDTTEIPAHTHSLSSHTHGAGSYTYSIAATGSGVDTRAAGSGAAQTAARAIAGTSAGPSTNTSGSAGGGTGHSHNIDLQVNYVDLILAKKD